MIKKMRTAAVLAVTGFSLMSCSQGSDPDADVYDDYYADGASGDTEFSAPERRPPADRGICTASQGCAPLTIHTSGGSNFYLVLKDSNTQRKAATIYIRTGQTYRGGMPNGSYDIYYTSGDTWYGKELFFGPEATVSKADSTMDFFETANGLSGVELTLQAVLGGNLSTSQGRLSDLR
ncbi:hypothetical protein [Nocardioides zhouii]|uniref:Lipoprotein n=1 Tax=Nocardioides zhouii TaxID=1168729 RepID=A0A4Q2SK02_9ACTN|nr:hypothetical protein [Nocardioides zhouii]RYC05752.1 hypothetical protein EUA94_17790 [Nocardioides zhouii]